MQRSATTAAISPALVKALGAIKGAAKDRKNPHFKNDYATLESVIEASRDILAENGLCVIQGLGAVEAGRLAVTTTLLHESGEWMESEFQMPLAKMDPQGTGSAATYARRYALMAVLNIAAVDDDGEAATDRGNNTEALALKLASELLAGCKTADAYREAWEKNKEGWKDLLSVADYAALVGRMKAGAAKFTAPVHEDSPFEDREAA